MVITCFVIGWLPHSSEARVWAAAGVLGPGWHWSPLSTPACGGTGGDAQLDALRDRRGLLRIRVRY
jgi:hypothetical protein